VKDHTALKQHFIQTYQTVRSKTEELCQPLMTEDYVIQSIDDTSPPKWHLAHTTWFFETFILIPERQDYKPFHPLFHHLFNSYYQRIGDPYPRVRRGVLSRPTVETVYAYRDYVDQHVIEYIEEHIEQLSETAWHTLISILILGLHHEQQHQELLLMDIKHNFSLDPHFPVYQAHKFNHHSQSIPLEFIPVAGGIVNMGYQGEEFCFDNELPRHQQILRPYLMANRLVTNAEYGEFIAADGYQNPEWWLADGWDCIQKNAWKTPLYWHQFDHQSAWHIFTLGGLCEVNPAEPVAHISYYEADAYARFRGQRLPSEVEWEYYASNQANVANGNFLETNRLHPEGSLEGTKGQQLLGDLWEWTASPYCPYPGFKPLVGTLGEYNGKFMSNQMVLRGGSCVTPQSHIRVSYRNFFQPDKRWQFSGIRLASDV
jgi:ergothioneine biosynthesis protein EgtB